VDSGRDLAERQPQPGLEQDNTNSKRDERLVERTEQSIRVDVVGHDPGHKPRRE
jgi:hypothetical protein